VTHEQTAIDSSHNQIGHQKYCEQHAVKVEEDKLFVVGVADTGAHPGTVVVHAQDASAALTTVVSSGRLKSLTVDAVLNELGSEEAKLLIV
jgi:hypothetical protein